MAEHVYIGVDIGGTRIRAARFSPDLQLQERTEALTLSERGQDDLVRRISDLIRAVWPGNGNQVTAIGLSVPGPSNPKTGIVIRPPNLKGWHNVPLQQIMVQTFNTKAYIGNDANLAALAETAMGAAHGHEDVVFLTISTGIGGGIVAGGHLLIGSTGIAAECGHTILVVEGNHVSSLEKEAAGPAIARQARSAIELGETSVILDMADGNLEAITARIVGQAAKAGDELGLRLIRRAGRFIGLGIVSFLHIFNPEIIVLGGGVFEGTHDILMEPLWDAVKQHALDPLYWQNLVIAPAQLGENVSLIGAAALAIKQTAE